MRLTRTRTPMTMRIMTLYCDYGPHPLMMMMNTNHVLRLPTRLFDDDDENRPCTATTDPTLDDDDEYRPCAATLDDDPDQPEQPCTATNNPTTDYPWPLSGPPNPPIEKYLSKKLGLCCMNECMHETLAI